MGGVEKTKEHGIKVLRFARPVSVLALVAAIPLTYVFELSPILLVISIVTGSLAGVVAARGWRFNTVWPGAIAMCVAVALAFYLAPVTNTRWDVVLIGCMSWTVVGMLICWGLFKTPLERYVRGHYT